MVICKVAVGLQTPEACIAPAHHLFYRELYLFIYLFIYLCIYLFIYSISWLAS